LAAIGATGSTFRAALLTGLFLSAAAARWEIVPSGTDRSLFQACFLDARKGFIAAAGGLLLATEDGGESWSPRDLGITDDVLGVRFFGASEGFAFGSHGLLMRTSDTGKTWRKIPVPSDADLTDLAFASPANAFMTGLADTLLVSRDSARTWSKRSTGKFGSLSITAHRIIPVRNDIAYLLTNYGILKSGNGGESWSPSPDLPLASFAFVDGYFFDADTGFFVSPGLSYGGIFRTTDGLASSRNLTGRAVSSIDFLDRETGFALHLNGRCWRTDDRGGTWKEDTNFVMAGREDGHRLLDIASIGGTGVLIVGEKGFIARLAVSSPAGINGPQPNRNAHRLKRSWGEGLRIDGRMISRSRERG
jgi:photosystem II stability/assembly factor-like uncharacterized protein